MKRTLSVLLSVLMLLVLLPAVETAKAETTIQAFTLSISEDIPTPVVGDPLFYPNEPYIKVTSTIPTGYTSALKVQTYWYNETTNETYYSGHSFTEGVWTLVVSVQTMSSDYQIDYETYFSYGGSLYEISLGGRPFTAFSRSNDRINYGTSFYLGTTPETIDLHYSTADFPLVSDRMTGAEAYQSFLNSIRSRRGPSYFDAYSGDASEGWYVDTDSGYTGFSDDPGEPWYLNESEEYLVPMDPYYITFDVGLAPGCHWHEDQQFTVNGDDDTIIEAPYLDEDGIEHVWVSYKIMSKEDLYQAEFLGVEPMNYTGSPLTQSNLQIVCNGELLAEGTDYVVSYYNNVEPGYGDIYVYGINRYCGEAYHHFKIFDSDHPHEVIDTLTANSNIDEVPVYGDDIKAPEFTVTGGEPGYFETGMGGWSKLIDGEWTRISSGQFTAGEWRFSCQIRIDDGGDRYSFSYRPTVKVNGVEWSGTGHASISDTYCYTYATSPVYTITGGGELIFNKLSSYYIDYNYVNEPITPFSVAGSVDGGTPPYTFSKTSGPDWVDVSADGTISGTPYQTGKNSNLVVRVTDDAGDYAEIEIGVYKTAKRKEDKTQISKIVASSDMKTMAVAGNTIEHPEFTVSEGLPSHFETGMGGWYYKDGDEWVHAFYSDTFTPGTWRFSCQIRIDDGGEEYVIADGPTVVVDGQTWTADDYTTTGFDFCYLYASSPAFTIADDSFTVAMDPDDVEFKGTTPYVVFDGSPAAPGVIVRDKDSNLIPASDYTVSYLENEQPGTGYAVVTMKATGGENRVFFKIYMPPTTTTTVANVTDGVKISWKAVPGAAGYVIYRRAWNLSSSGWTSFERWNNTTATTWTDTKVYAGTRYQYGVKAYFARRTDPVSCAEIGGVFDNYNLGMVGPLKTTVRITTRKLVSVTPATKQLTVKWEASSKFTGYQVQYATNASFSAGLKTITISNPKTTQRVIKDLKAKTTYYVRVRSYHVFQSTTYYGGWSNVLYAKTK
ncbi:MAG: fibronectin type III domain-containing protein [Clostridia bacterium]|nr:fibronectin type III domain-containing protein [Clostridia bacterium]